MKPMNMKSCTPKTKASHGGSFNHGGSFGSPGSFNLKGQASPGSFSGGCGPGMCFEGQQVDGMGPGSFGPLGDLTRLTKARSSPGSHSPRSSPASLQHGSSLGSRGPSSPASGWQERAPQQVAHFATGRSVLAEAEAYGRSAGGEPYPSSELSQAARRQHELWLRKTANEAAKPKRQ